jgi:hypothetical protein
MPQAETVPKSASLSDVWLPTGTGTVHLKILTELR